MKIRFTLSLSDKTVRALGEEAGGTDGEIIKDHIVEHLKDWFEEVREGIEEEDE